MTNKSYVFAMFCYVQIQAHSSELFIYTFIWMDQYIMGNRTIIGGEYHYFYSKLKIKHGSPQKLYQKECVHF